MERALKQQSKASGAKNKKKVILFVTYNQKKNFVIIFLQPCQVQIVHNIFK